MNGLISGQTLGADQVNGDFISLKRTDPRHLMGSGETTTQNQSGGFGQLLLDGLSKVDQLQKDHQQLSVQAITDPNSVDVHNIMIAEAKANLALNITKNVVDRALNAYQNIINLH